MSIFKKSLNLVFAGVIFILLGSCSKDNPNFLQVVDLKPPTNGTLWVQVQNGPNSYVSGAVVKLFTSIDDRKNVVNYQNNSTAYIGPNSYDIYAVFDNLNYGKYFVQADANLSGVNYTGMEQGGSGFWVAKGMTTVVNVMVY